MAIWFALILGAYLLGSVPAAYLVAKLRGIDLKRYGTGQAGAGNLWRMTSWQFGLPAGVFDFSKGLMMIWVAELLGLDIAQQLVVGTAAIIGHNWPVFLRFSGGRGVLTLLGVALILVPKLALTLLIIALIGLPFGQLAVTAITNVHLDTALRRCLVLVMGPPPFVEHAARVRPFSTSRNADAVLRAFTPFTIGERTGPRDRDTA